MVYDLIYFISIIISILVAVYLFVKLKPTKFSLHTNILGVYFLLNAFCFIFYIIIKYGWISFVPLLYKIPAPITYLIAPAAYFHVRLIVSKSPKLKVADSFHLVPFLVFFISYLPFYLQDVSIKSAYVDQIISDYTLTYTDNVGLIPESANSLGRLIHPLLYIIWQWILLNSSKAKALKLKSKSLFRWVYNFVLFQTLFFSSLIITSLVYFYFSADIDNELIGNISTMLTVSFFFSLSIYLFWNQDILRKLKYYSPSIDADDNTFSESKDLQNITSFVYDKKIFLEKDSDLIGISRKIGVSKTELSHLIHTEYSNFNAWLNAIKIQYAIELMKGTFLDNFSVDALIDECGFNSKKTFYRAFKTKTGLTPTAFLKARSTTVD